MAKVVTAMAMTHSPGLTGWFDRAPLQQQLLAKKAMDEMRWRLEAAKPDVILGFSNDHLLNWPINNIPELTVGIGEMEVTGELLIGSRPNKVAVRLLLGVSEEFG